MKKHINIPIFIPHIGCPNQCVFCNQRSISGVIEFNPENTDKIITDALETVPCDTDVEIAFFGGSFTGIDEGLMVRLLEIANKYIKSGRVSSIRCSTRPDYINAHVLDILEKYGVRTVELGLQSVSERVLTLSGRGHGFAEEVTACRMITERGFNLVGQMMIGLPGSTLEDEIETAKFIVASGAMGARIYPTVVFRDTELCCMAKNGEYEPLSLGDAVSRSAKVLRIFCDAGVKVIRVGLCSSENLSSDDTYFAGPNHPALGELIENEIYFENICRAIESQGFDNNCRRNAVLKVSVSRGSLSKAIGQKRINKNRLIELYGFCDVVFAECDDVAEYTVSISNERK